MITTQPSLFGDDYAAALATIRASGIPWPVVVMHLRYGVKAGETCGACDWRCELHVNGIHHYCGLSWSQADLPAETVACRRWEAKR